MFCLFLTGTIWAQQTTGSLYGSVLDTTGAVIPGANVDILQGENVVRHVKSDGLGNFSASGLPPGVYLVHVAANGFQQVDSEPATVAAGSVARIVMELDLLISVQEVTVNSDQAGAVSLESSDNANAIVLRGADLDALPDDSEELLADLQALAGPPMGSGGAQVYVNGFSSQRLPPKNAIREVRINVDPFSAQYDHVGFGRVEVVTKPGSELLHGSAQFKISDAVLNSRNPYSLSKPPYQAKQLTGNLGGPLISKRASFFLDFDGRWATDNEIVNATILDASLNITPFQQAILMPDREQSVGGRIDYKLNDKHNLTGRYEWDRSGQDNTGVGGFALASRAYAVTNTAQTFQLTENAVLTNTAINQTRFQFVRSSLGQQATSFAPTIQVQDAFTSGGAQVGQSRHTEELTELRNSTTTTIGTHAITFGGQIHHDAIYDSSPLNFGGAFVFSGGPAPELDIFYNIVLDSKGNPIPITLSSIQRYQRTLLLQQAGFSQGDVIVRGGGSSQFSIAAGQPASSHAQTYVGLFVQDSWRLRPTLSLNAGVRWEGQNDTHNWKDFAPRLGLSWLPGGKHGKTVIRLGGGIFYDRFPVSQVLQTLRFNGQTQQQFVVNNPSFYPQIPSIASLEAMGAPQTIRSLAPGLRAPYLIQTSVGVEREMPLGLLVSLNYVDTRGKHLLVSRNSTITGNINYQYASAGLLNQQQFVASVRRPLHSGLTVFGRYEYSKAFSNTDGINTFPANQNNLHADYGPTATDIRNTLVVGGSLAGPLGISLNPFLVARSGAPFNITTGHDNNGDTLFTDRPAFGADPNQPGVVKTPFGIFDSTPAGGATVIPHNYSRGSGFTMLNLRLSRTFGFGEPSDGGKKDSSGKPAPALGSKWLFATPNAEYRYSFTLGIIVRNLLNITNPGTPVGSLGSPSFGRAKWLASAASPTESAFGNNRRLQFQVRFDF